MMALTRIGFFLFVFCCFSSHLFGVNRPQIVLGPADELAIDQPRVAVNLVDPRTGKNLGPDFASTFLLDTGANGILIVDDAIFELNSNGYQTEGTFFEQGVAGFTEFDVSAEYDILVSDSNQQIVTIEKGRAMSSTTTSFCPIPGLCSFFGIMGMPAMVDRVTTMDLSTISGGGLVGGDIFGDLFNLDFMSTVFSNDLPATNRRRFSVPIKQGIFPPETDGPVPTWADLPFVVATTEQDGVKVSGDFVLDTGAQLSIISTKMAFDLGLDANGNGLLQDEAVGTQQLGGVGGTIDAPVMLVEKLNVPTEEGIDLVYTNVSVAVVDISPKIDGIFGMNLLSSGWLGASFGGDNQEADLLGLLEDAGLADLLAELGGLGGSLTGSPYPFFEKVHFDFREHHQGNGRMVFDLTDDVTGIVAGPGDHGDIDNDNDVDFDDREAWIHDVVGSSFGDANLDGVFNSRDLVQVFQAAQYEDGIKENSNWAQGDFNGDYEFDTKDLVLAFQDGAYEQPAGAEVVPEPSAIALSLVGFASLLLRRVSSKRKP